MASLDWSQCPAVESIPGKVSGAWVLKGTRMPVSAIFENLEAGANIDDIMEWFDGLDREPVKTVIEFAARSLDKEPVYAPCEDRRKMTSDEYKKAFRLLADAKAQNGEVLDSPKAQASCESALAIALDIRKFEIELYWKRAAYFWSFLAVTLAGYFGLLVAKDLPSTQQAEALLTVSCLGVVFSIAWYFVNRASKFWQENWEKHVDLLEDARIGPLYKTVLSRDDLRFWRLFGPYPFSVSKLNQLLSLFVTGLFLILAARTLCRYYRIGRPLDVFATAVVTFTVVTVCCLWCKGRTEPLETPSRVRAKLRTTEIKDS